MITIKSLKKEYKTSSMSVKALNGVDLDISNNGLVSILGPSGCGKTTLLNIIGGLDSNYEGDVIVNGKNIKKMHSHERDIYRNQEIGFVFQEYNLISTLNIYSNIELALALSKASNKEKKKKIYELAQNLGIEKLLKKYPNELSGGQKQRAVIARALINDPKILLADEPTGALDSKTSIQILSILKEISKNKLVIMVTHNKELALEYSDRIVNLHDGQIINDEIRYLNEDIIQETSIKKIHNPFKNLFKMSSHNLLKKWLRTLLIIIACSIGIIALCIVVTVANGMSLYISDVQKKALKTYPITINSNIVNEEINNNQDNYKDYPSEEKIYITDDPQVQREHVNTFTNEFMTYIKNMNTNIYSAMSYSGWLKMHILAQNENSYNWISGYFYMKELCYNDTYINEEYDTLSGKIPSNKDEIAIVIDKNNCVSRDMLTYIGLKYDDKKELSFNELIGKEYKVIDNNLYYVKDNNRYVTFSYKGIPIEDIYESSNISLKIVGILRQKSTAQTKLYGTTLLYTPQLTEYMLKINGDSDIVKEQIANPTINVLTGNEYKEINTSSQVQTVEYQYENMLINLGYHYTITRILIYTFKFENFELIHQYIEKYNEDKIAVSQIKYTDYLQNLTAEFDLFMDILTKTLLMFALVSLVVAGIMIVIITYVSVLEQIKEIGILRSIGISKVNVACVFIYENVIIGFISGVIGVVTGSLLIKPILNEIVTIIKNNNVTHFTVESLQMDGFNLEYMILIVLASVLLTVFSGLIPSIIAAKQDPIKSLNRV